MNLFKNSPKKYIPEYGGWCAYAIALKNKKVTIDPVTYEIRDGNLYLFYKTKFINTHKKWLTKNPKKLIQKANVNWIGITNKQKKIHLLCYKNCLSRLKNTICLTNFNKFKQESPIFAVY